MIFIGNIITNKKTASTNLVHLSESIMGLRGAAVIADLNILFSEVSLALSV